jgi:raffinose/stachyose/melibiose transport system substrate-binding protein
MKKFVAMFLLVLLIAPAVFAGGGAEDQEIVLSWPTIWVGQDSKAATVEALVNEFNAMHEGEIRVEMEPNPNYDEYRNKINTQIAAGVVPDIFVFNPDPTSFSYYESDLLMDFTDDLRGAWGRDFVDGQIAQATRNGRTKSVPFEVAITPIWANEALMAQAGIDSFPTDFEEFVEAAAKFKAAGIVPTSQMTGGSNAWTSMLWYSHIMASLGGPDVWEKHRLGGDDDIYVQAAEYLLALYSDGNTTRDAVGGDAGVSGGHYLAQNTALFINGPWYIGRVRGDAPKSGKLPASTPHPRYPVVSTAARSGSPVEPRRCQYR